MSASQILLTGSSGFIGTSLVRSLVGQRISIISLLRRPLSDGGGLNASSQQLWNPYAATPVSDPRAFDGTTAAVHLSGANLAGRRWTSAYKREILDSRVKPTHALATLLAGLRPKPAVLVCAAAIGIYGSCGDESLMEASLPGNGFLPQVCLAWEKATQPASDAGIRVVHLRFGVCALRPMEAPWRRCCPSSAPGWVAWLGSSRQWMSWAALPDAVRAIEFALQTASLSWPLNVVAPNPVTNLEFTRSLGRALHRPTLMSVPAFALRLALGEMAEATILESQRVIPAQLSGSGFDFEYAELEAGLRALLTS